MPTIISNTTVLLYLYRVGKLELLKALYGKIVIPHAVANELAQGKREGEDVPKVESIDWIEIRPVKIPEIVKLITDLGPGEAEVLTLALEEPGALAVLDDFLARRIARLHNIKITGTAGILLKAKKQGHISEIGPIIDRLLKSGFRLSERMKRDILRLAGELK